MKSFNMGTVILVLSIVVLLHQGNCQTQYKNGEQQNWATEWRNWAGRMWGNGAPGTAGSGDPWLQTADRYMTKWMNNYGAGKASGKNQPGGFFAKLMDGIHKMTNEKKNKKNKKSKQTTESYIQ